MCTFDAVTVCTHGSTAPIGPASACAPTMPMYHVSDAAPTQPVSAMPAVHECTPPVSLHPIHDCVPAASQPAMPVQECTPAMSLHPMPGPVTSVTECTPAVPRPTWLMHEHTVHPGLLGLPWLIVHILYLHVLRLLHLLLVRG